MKVFVLSFQGAWEKIGCYSNKSPTNALPDSFGDIKSGSDPDTSYDFCKGKAESLGYKIFGVDDKSKNCLYGEKAEMNYNKYGTSKLCVFSKAKTGHATGKSSYGNMFVCKQE